MPPTEAERTLNAAERIGGYIDMRVVIALFPKASIRQGGQRSLI